MSIKIDSTDISAVCDKIYVGSDEVYSSAPSLYTWNDLKAFALIIKNHSADFPSNAVTGANKFLDNISTIETKFANANINLNDYNTFDVVYRTGNPQYFYVYLIASSNTPSFSGNTANFSGATGYRLDWDSRHSWYTPSSFTENINWNNNYCFGLQNVKGLTYALNCNFENKYENYK